MGKQIEVWYDTLSQTRYAVWCVSLCEEDGQELCCLYTHYDRDRALAAARKAARQQGLRLCERGERGLTELATAETLRIEAVLLSYGARYSGSCVEDEAQSWADHGFTAYAADDWCEIGVWDAATAAELRDAGLTPERARAAAERLTEGLDDPAAVYTDGDPLYAACNGDLAISVIVEAAKAAKAAE